jgi:pimeloyl-ACP methyl ester carboxylesterase
LSEQVLPTGDTSGDFARIVEDPSSDRLWCVFSHINVPRGKFSQSRVFEKMPGKKIFLNSNDNDWYQKGVEGIADTPARLLAWIGSQIRDYSPNKVTIVGHSMGGYMAARAATRFPNIRFVVTSPELQLGVPRSRSAHHGVKVGRKSAWVRNTGDRPLPTNGLVLFGAFDPIDAYFLAQPQTHELFGTAVRECAYHHGVTEYLSANGHYVPLLKNPASAAVPLKVNGILAPAFTWGDAEQYAAFYHTYCLFKSGASATDRALRTYAGWTNPGWQSLRHHIFERAGEHGLARDAAELAFEVAPDVPEYAENLVRACVQSKDKRRLAAMVDHIQFAFPRHTLGKRALALVNEAMPDLVAGTFKGTVSSASRVESSAFRRQWTDRMNRRALDSEEIKETSLKRRSLIINRLNKQARHTRVEILARAARVYEAGKRPNDALVLARQAFLAAPDDADLASRFVKLAAGRRRFEQIYSVLKRVDLRDTEYLSSVVAMKPIAKATHDLGLTVEIAKLLLHHNLLSDEDRAAIDAHVSKHVDRAGLKRFWKRTNSEPEVSNDQK